MTEARENILYGVLKIKQPDEKDGLRVNLDTILLAHFTRPRLRDKTLELGCAHGSVSLILAKRGFMVEGVDIQPHLIEMAVENAEFNGLNERAKFYLGDLREHKKIWSAQTFDRIVVNPPYYESDSIRRSPSNALAAAMHGSECTLEDVVVASRYLLKNRGHLNMVIRANRIGQLFVILDKYNVVPKLIRSVHPKPGADATVVLVEAVRAANHGLTIQPPLFVLGADGKETKDLLEAYIIEENY